MFLEEAHISHHSFLLLPSSGEPWLIRRSQLSCPFLQEALPTLRLGQGP